MPTIVACVRNTCFVRDGIRRLAPENSINKVLFKKPRYAVILGDQAGMSATMFAAINSATFATPESRRTLSSSSLLGFLSFF